MLKAIAIELQYGTSGWGVGGSHPTGHAPAPNPRQGTPTPRETSMKEAPPGPGIRRRGKGKQWRQRWGD